MKGFRRGCAVASRIAVRRLAAGQGKTTNGCNVAAADVQIGRFAVGCRPSAGIGRRKLANRFETERSRSLSLADKALSTLSRHFACSKADLTFRG
jgi:hypothetical protein